MVWWKDRDEQLEGAPEGIALVRIAQEPVSVDN